MKKDYLLKCLSLFVKFNTTLLKTFSTANLDTLYVVKNSKVFEQKGDLLNFKAKIDPVAVLSQVKPG